MTQEKINEISNSFKELAVYYRWHNIDIYKIIRFIMECNSSPDYELDVVEEKWLFFDCSIDSRTITAWREWEHMVREFKMEWEPINVAIDMCNFMVQYNYQD